MCRDGAHEQISEVHHVGLVVADLEQALGKWQRTLGTRPAWVAERVEIPAFDSGDGPVAPSYHIGVGMVSLGNVILEFVAPLDGHSLFHRFLHAHGEGLHHLAFWLPSLGAQVSRLEGCGLKRTAGNATPGPDDVSWLYVEGEATTGVVLELMNRDSASEKFFTDIYSVVGQG